MVSVFTELNYFYFVSLCFNLYQKYVVFQGPGAPWSKADALSSPLLHPVARQVPLKSLVAPWNETKAT